MKFEMISGKAKIPKGWILLRCGDKIVKGDHYAAAGASIWRETVYAGTHVGSPCINFYIRRIKPTKRRARK